MVFVVSKRKLNRRLTPIIRVVDIDAILKEIFNNLSFVLVLVRLDGVVQRSLAVFINVVDV